jgi:hypothetical protein
MFLVKKNQNYSSTLFYFRVEYIEPSFSKADHISDRYIYLDFEISSLDGIFRFIPRLALDGFCGVPSLGKPFVKLLPFSVEVLFSLSLSFSP